MSEDAAHHSFWQTSDFVFVVALLSSLILGFLFPLSFPPTWPKILLSVIGVGLVLIGLRFIILSKSHLRREGQSSQPGKPTTRLVKNGIFSVSRNPSYFGLVVIFAGLGLLLRLPWIMILLIPSIIVVHFILVLPEERYLDGKFGEEYRRYVKSVRRWI